MEEAENTQIFKVSEQAELELSGYVTSMKVSRRVTLWRYSMAAAVPIGIFTSDWPDVKTGEEGDLTNLWIALGVGFICMSFDYPVLTATVEYCARITRKGEPVIEKDIKYTEEDTYSVWAEWSWEDASEKAAVVLDRAIKNSIKQLFEELLAEKDALSGL